MKKIYALTVGMTVGTHFGYLIYLPSGGFLALRWPRSIVLHLATVGWGVCVLTLGLPCPLTQLEQWARVRAGMDALPQAGFTERYVAGVFYPSHATRIAQVLAFAAAALSWVLLAFRQRQSASRPSRLRS
jgi:Protein of Unknown function (DUF2784)